MDSLALLCNLYGDGPATVRRLREAGLGSLESLDVVEPERLAALLRTSVRAAQRFRAEARLLLERTTAAVERPAAVEETTGPSDPLLRKVLDAWRRKDAEDGAAPVAPAAKLSPVPPQAAVEEPASVVEQEPPPEPLSASALDCLGAGAIEALQGAGIQSLEGLARCEALEVSARSGLSYTRLLRLQLLARRALATRAEQPPPGTHGLLHPSPPPILARSRPADSSAKPDEPPPDPRFSPAEGPPQARPAPLEPVVGPRVDRRAAAESRVATDADTLESAGPFA